MGVLQDVIDSVFTPGTNHGLEKAMNYSFYGLFLTLFGLGFLTDWNIHVIALSFIAVMLFVSTRWFIGELGRQKEAERARTDDETASARTSATSHFPLPSDSELRKR
ncbi:uncharacterized protein L969DRAFT_18763 [Mixia osmundae IAM 14324]|uniref:Uncharacterized protein n=1 Tax=Mixia osmundae (strain CBS 9802 / IAM 14324 / JCM 22182 / KY 12970) TaxID=764103 RepID=G7DSH2_MIXOS|nr:uncharacterized protein L969DRAFT_18763 [Mixia osmundae IAM 14324]KEI37972.1 hypothetical protein L969DRAFT_18763 [Mixia osmundae IAM 14324]GAA93532.1 hypothetical protein E5Q_00174 [Mixia osmundae IAM 14324]